MCRDQPVAPPQTMELAAALGAQPWATFLRRRSGIGTRERLGVNKLLQRVWPVLP